MWRFSVFFFALMGTTICTTPADRLPAYFPRPNWGVSFTKTDTFIAGHTPYLHSFLTPVPRLDYRSLPTVPCSTVAQKVYSSCELVNERIDAVNAHYQLAFSVVQHQIDQTLKSMPNMNEMNGKKRRTRSVDMVEDSEEADWHHFNPDFCRPDYPVPSENSWGRFWEKITGSPSHADLDVMRQHTCLLAKASDISKQRIMRLGKTLTAVTAKLTEGADTLYRRLENERTNFIGVRDKYNQLLNDTVQDLNLLARRVCHLELSQQRTVALSAKLNTHSAAADRHLRLATRFGTDLDQLIGGRRLRAALVSLEDLSDALDHAKTVLAANGRRHVLLHDNPMFYYKAARPYTAYVGNNLIITLNFDTGTYEGGGGLLGLYRVDKTFLSVDGRRYVDHERWVNVASTKIVNLPDFYAISADLRYGVPMTTAEVVTCTGLRWNTDTRFSGTSHTVCKDQGLADIALAPTCVSAVFRDNKEAVKKHCKVVFAAEDIETTTVNVGDNTYLLHSPANVRQIAMDSTNRKDSKGESTVRVTGPQTITIRCDHGGSRGSSVTKTMRACSTCLVHLACGCSLSSTDFSIPTRHCEQEDDTVPVTEVTRMFKFPLNLHAAMGKYSVERLENILATDTTDSLFDDVPVRLDDLEKTINFTNFNFTGTVERMQPYVNDLNIAVANAKRFGKAYATKASELYNRATDFSDLNTQHFRALYESLKKGPFSGFKASVATGASMGLVSVALAIFTCYLCCCHHRRK